MELELGLKITKTKDDIDSISEFQFMKDAGPIFHSRETNTMFILTANLKGYKRNNIDIKISKDGSKISISGKKPIQEMVMMGWVMQRKVVDVKGFNKVFKIPHGVNLDKIKASYNEEEWMMNIVMPKLVKGICGLKIEEFNEQYFDKGKSHLEESEIDHVSSSVGETSQKGSKDSEFQRMEGSENIIEKMLDDTNKKFDKETIQRVFEESMIQQSGESKQKESKEHLEECEIENSMEPFEAMKVLEVEQNVVGHITSNIGCMNQNEFEESRIPQMKNTIGKMNGGEDEKLGFEANQHFPKEIIKPEIKTKDGDQECVLEKLGGKEGLDDEMVLIKEIPKHLPRSTSKERGGLNVEKMQETKNVKEEMVNKEVEYFMENGEGERFERKHGEPKKENNTKETMREKIAESENVHKESGHEQFAGIEGSKRFNFENVEEQNKVSKEALDENEILMVEGCEHKERTKKIRQEMEDTVEYSTVKLKGNESIKMGENELNESGHDMFDPPIDTREELKNISIEKTKSIEESVKECSMEPFEATKVSKLEAFEANDDDYKNFIKPKRETIDEEPNGKKPNKEGFDAKITINEEFRKNLPKSTNEQNEGLNVLKMQETKDVKENVVKRKGKEIEYFKEMDKGDRLKMMDVDEMKVSNTKETTQEEIEKSDNGIKGGGQEQAAKIEGSKGFNVAKEEEKEKSKKRSKSKEQDEESISHNIVDSGQTVFEEALIQQSGESKQKEVGGSKCDSKERLKEVLKESSMEQNADHHIHSKIGCIIQNEFKEHRVPQNEKTKSTNGKKKNGEMNSEKTPFEVNEDVQKVVFGDAIQKEVVKMNEEFPKKSFDESEGLNVQKIQESKNVKEEMVDKEIEYFKEKGEGERFKRMHVKTKKGNTRETMQEEIEKSDNEVKESGQQHAKENTTKEMDEVSNNVTGELKQTVAEIGESKGLNVEKEEEQKEVTKKSFVENESLIEKVEGQESKERIKTKGVQDGDDKIEFSLVKLKGKGSTKIHGDGRSFQEKEESEDFNEKAENFGKKVNNKIQNEEDEDLSKGVTKKKDQCCLPDDASKKRSQDTNDAKEGFPMKISESQIDTREKLKDRKIENIKGLRENEKVVQFVKKVKFEEEEFKKRITTIVVDEEVKNDYGIMKLKGEGSINLTHKFQEKEEIEDVNERSEKTEEFVKKVDEKLQNEEDEAFKKNTIEERDECFLQEEMNKGRSQASKAANEPFENRIEEENSNQKHDPMDEFIEKENFGIGTVDGRKIPKFRVMNQTQDAKEKGAHSEKTMKKMNGNKEVSEKVEQVEANEGLRIGVEERIFGESMTKEELQEFEMERIINPEREFQSVVSIGFKEFGYENAKDKMLDTKFESKERYESKDESMIQEVFIPKSPKEVGENCTRNELCKNEVEIMEDQVINPISVPRFESEVEENDKLCEGNKAKYNGYGKSKKDGPTKDVKNLIEMKEKEEKRGEKGEFHNGEKVRETMQEKTEEPEKKTIDDKRQENVTRYDGKVETKEKDMFKEYKSTQKANEEKFKIQDDITKSSIENEKEEESLEESLKNDISEMKTERSIELDSEQQDNGIKEIEAPKTVTCEGDKPSKLERPRFNKQATDEINTKPECVIEEYEATKESQKLNSVETEKIDILQPQFLDGEEKVLEKREGPKVAKREEAKNASKLKRESGKITQSTEEMMHKMKEIASQFDTASGSKRVAEEVHETLKREHQRKSKEVTSEMEVEPSTIFEKTLTKKVHRKGPHELTKPPNMHYEIPNEKEFRKEEGKKHIQILEASISKENEDRDQQYVQEKNDKKVFPTPNTVEEEKVLKKSEGPKVALFDMASGSKRVEEKVHETSERETEEYNSKIEVEPPTIVKRKEARELAEEEGGWNIRVPEATISKRGTQVTSTHSIENSTALEVVADKEAQQFEVEGKAKRKEKESKMDMQDSTKSKIGQIVEHYINKDEQAKHAIDEQKEDKQCINKEEEEDNEKVYEEQRESKNETGAKTSKKVLVPLVIAGTALVATTAFIFVRHRRSRKM